MTELEWDDAASRWIIRTNRGDEMRAEAGATIAAIIKQAIDSGADQVEVTSEAEQTWMAMLEAGGRTFGGDPSCTPGYYNNEGQDPTPADSRNAAGYPAGPVAFFDFIDQWRDSGTFEGLEFRSR